MIDAGECSKTIDTLRLTTCVRGMNLRGRYGGEDTHLMNLTKADQAEQHRRTGACFGIDPESHRQTHSQATHDQSSRSSTSISPAGYGIIPDADIKGANYLLSSGQCHVLDHELRRAGVYLSLTN